MENIIGRLLEIDREACKLVEDAALLREQGMADIAAAKSEVYQHARSEAEERIAGQRTRAEAEIAAAKAEVAAAAAENRAALTQHFTEHREEWVDAIVAACTTL